MGTGFAADGYVAEFGLVKGVEESDAEGAFGNQGDFVIVGVGGGELAFDAVEDLVGGNNFLTKQVLRHGVV